jgi:hypothetical protein
MATDRQNREAWEDEVVAGHRWGQYGDRANQEYACLKALWDTIQPVSDDTRGIIDQIVSLEICNWRLEESIMMIGDAIGRGIPSELGIGHGRSMTAERWQEYWAYYLSLRKWLNKGLPNGYPPFLVLCDPDGQVEMRLTDMLGERTQIKGLYVERLCLCLERWFFLGRVHANCSSVV